MIETQPQPFNRKLGLFNHYVNKTKMTKDCNDAFKELQLKKKGLWKEPTRITTNYIEDLRLSRMKKTISPIKEQAQGGMDAIKEPDLVSPKSIGNKVNFVFTPNSIDHVNSPEKMGNLNVMMQTFNSSKPKSTSTREKAQSADHKSAEEEIKEDTDENQREITLQKKDDIEQTILDKFLPNQQSVKQLHNAFKKFTPKFRNYEEFKRQEEYYKERLESR